MRRTLMIMGLEAMVVRLLGCARDPAGRTVSTRPDGHCRVGGTYPLSTHGQDSGAGIPVPGTGR
jgi:hypothetical protein